jgi:mono/diheme cytochrome c family protein
MIVAWMRGTMTTGSVCAETSLLVGLGWLACARTPLGATVEDIARAQSQSQQGANVYAAECASCHGQRGEGLAAAPAILGPGALPEYPRTSTTAGDPTITDPQL